jgi:hypothetical protein
VRRLSALNDNPRAYKWAQFVAAQQADAVDCRRPEMIRDPKLTPQSGAVLSWIFGRRD